MKKLLNEKGFILVTVYMVIALVAIFSISFFARGNAFAQATERNMNKVVAFNMAEAGIDWAMTQLATNQDYSGTPSYVPMDTNFVQGGFTVTVSPDVTNPLIRVIQANGFAPNNDNTSRAYQTATIKVYAQFRQSSPFLFAVFAKDTITLTGTDKNASVDSYDSRLGPYTSIDSGDGGDIAVNSIAADVITLNGSTLVNGTPYVGPGGDPATGVDMGPQAATTKPPDSLDEEQVYSIPTTSVPVSGSLDIQGGVVPLPAGTYHYSSVNITGTGQLSLTGPVKIFVDGSVNIAGNGVATQGNLPTNLLLFVIGTDTVKVAGNGGFYGAIYAPNALVKNDGNAGIFGSIVADDYVQTGNSSIHFDVALKDIETEERLTDLHALAWQEQNSLTWGTGVTGATAEAEAVPAG